MIRILAEGRSGSHLRGDRVILLPAISMPLRLVVSLSVTLFSSGPLALGEQELHKVTIGC
jgi:hypothetical protein